MGYSAGVSAETRTAPPELPAALPTRLNLGCGRFPRPGFFNVDLLPEAPADLQLDLDVLESYRIFPAGHFEHVVADHVIEHLHDVFGVMAELHRILRPGGRLEIRVPHFSRGITHPQHQHGFDVTFPEYFKPSFAGYVGVPFELVSMRLEYMIRFDLKAPLIRPWQIAVLERLNRVVSWLANLQPYACSRFWCYLVGGFEQIEFVFTRPR